MSTKPNIIVDIVRACTLWRISAKQIERAIAETLHCQKKFRNPLARQLEICVTLTSDRKIRVLNKKTRGMDKPTNVLSFPLFPEKNIPVRPLGDIVIAYETVRREAVLENKRFLDHFTHMVVHGTLHLLGYDHETHAQARTMERLEVRILDALGTPNPYPHRESEKARTQKTAKRGSKSSPQKSRRNRAARG